MHFFRDDEEVAERIERDHIDECARYYAENEPDVP